MILIGHEDTLGEASAIQLAVAPDDVARVDIPHPGGVPYLTQTALALDETVEIIDVLRALWPALRRPPTDGVCYATTNRQQAVAAEADVVGSGNFSSSVRWAAVSHRHYTPASVVEDAFRVQPSWLTDTVPVGLAAGVSTLQQLLEEVTDTMPTLGPVTVVALLSTWAVGGCLEGVV